MRPTWPDTHGRWPWVAAAAVVPASLVAWKRRDDLARDAGWAFWLGGPALLWHQCEEWVWPGGFLPWFNRTVMGGGDEFPITRRAGFGINVGLGWGLCLASSLAGRRAPHLVTLNLGLMAGNAALHLGQAAKQRRYNPGLVTAAGLFCPLVTLAALRLGRDPDVGARVTGVGVAGGLLASVGLFARTRRRGRRSASVQRVRPPDGRGAQGVRLGIQRGTLCR